MKRHSPLSRVPLLLLASASTGLLACGPQAPLQQASDDTTGTEQQALTGVICPGATTLLGVDVSRWQASIDWNAVKGAGVKFAYASVEHGLSVQDAYFRSNWANMKAAGVPRGAYNYLVPSEDINAQADSLVSKMGPLGPGDLPPMLDVEQTDGLDRASLTAKVKQWLSRVEAATGKKPLIYASGSFWDTNVVTTDFTGYPLWIANYGTNCPRVPTAYTTFAIHQYSDTGQVPGIAGNVDMDHFNGNLAQLQALGGSCTVTGNILGEYDVLGGPTSILGKCTTSELSTPDGVGRFNHFERGSIYWTPTTAAHEVHGAIHDAWAALGWETKVGYPTTDEQTGSDGVGKYNRFTGYQGQSSIYFSATSGAHELHGDIHARFLALGAEGKFGYPLTDESSTPDTVGRYNHFSKNASIYSSPAGGTHAVQGDIRQLWSGLKWEAGPLGYPTSDETVMKDRRGLYNTFQQGGIFTSPSTGTHALTGAVYAAWKALGEGGCLGLPTADVAVSGGLTMATFENGTITLDTSGPAQTSCARAKLPPPTNPILEDPYPAPVGLTPPAGGVSGPGAGPAGTGVTPAGAAHTTGGCTAAGSTPLAALGLLAGLIRRRRAP